MNNQFSSGMTKATELTKAGRLQEATALIQSLLQSGQTGAAAAPLDGDVIEGTFTALTPGNQTLDKANIAPGQPGPAGKEFPKPRSPLRETLRRIKAGGMPARAPLHRAPIQIPEGAQFLLRTHKSAHGTRDYWLYVPAHRPETPMPLVLMLHGCTQTPEDFATGTAMNAVAEENGCLIAYPAQSSAANANKCWNWFDPKDQGRDRGEPAIIAGLTDDILRDYPADPARVYIAGLSAGGAAAAIIAAAYPDRFSAVGVHSGLAVGAATDIPSAFAAMNQGSAGKPKIDAMPAIIFHGAADKTVHPRNGKAMVSQVLCGFSGLKTSVEKGKSPGGAAFRKTGHSGSDERTLCEYWEIEGAGHAWAGGSAAGSYTDPKGPDASREMMRFFLQHRQD